MTVRELIKHLEVCDLDKNVHIIVSTLSSDDTSVNLLLREINGIVENNELVGIQ